MEEMVDIQNLKEVAGLVETQPDVNVTRTNLHNIDLLIRVVKQLDTRITKLEELLGDEK